MPNSIPQRKARSEIVKFVKARQKIYKHSTEIYFPNVPYEKLEEGYEPAKSLKRTLKTQIPIPTPEEEKLDRTRRRAYVRMKDIVLSNDFELFVTFTFKSERNNPDKCKEKLSGWLKRQRKIDKSFQYIVVPEFHKDRESLHFHALIKGFQGRLVRVINPLTGRPLDKKGRSVLDIPNYTLGFCEAYQIGTSAQDHIVSGFYLLKYVKKDMPAFLNKKRFWASRGLDKPTVIENPDEWFYGLKPDHQFKSDYGLFLFFNNWREDVPKTLTEK